MCTVVHWLSWGEPPFIVNNMVILCEEYLEFPQPLFGCVIAPLFLAGVYVLTWFHDGVVSCLCKFWRWKMCSFPRQTVPYHQWTWNRCWLVLLQQLTPICIPCWYACYRRLSCCTSVLRSPLVGVLTHSITLFIFFFVTPYRNNWQHWLRVPWGTHKFWCDSRKLALILCVGNGAVIALSPSPFLVWFVLFPDQLAPHMRIAWAWPIIQDSLWENVAVVTSAKGVW